MKSHSPPLQPKLLDLESELVIYDSPEALMCDQVTINSSVDEYVQVDAAGRGQTQAIYASPRMPDNYVTIIDAAMTENPAYGQLPALPRRSRR